MYATFDESCIKNIHRSVEKRDMETRAESWIPIKKIYPLVDFEPVLVIFGLTFVAWIIYRYFMRDFSLERRTLIKDLLTNLYAHVVNLVVLLLLFWGLGTFADVNAVIDRILPYVGLIALISGTVVFIKVAKILVFEYLFLGSKRSGVPVLLVNLMMLILSLVIAAWLATHVFSVQLTPLLATSAIFSVVLGLALQETLGNLFAGISLQMDKPYEIGDWIEINNGSNKWVGQVSEISWRSTVLVGFADEMIVLSNRTMTQSEISNFSRFGKPIIRSTTFRLSHDVPTEVARRVLVDTALKVVGVCKAPPPSVFISEATESWVTLRLIYYIDDYGGQYSVTDRVLAACLEEFRKNKIEFARQRLDVQARTL